MTKIGVLYGMEESFPPALVDRINGMGVTGVTAEHLHVGSVQMAAHSGYDVIIDRISHDIPFYRSYLKNAVLTGTKVINNPFWWSADDKFFNYALASRLGVAVPPTVLLPHKQHPAGTSEKSMRNLEFPLDWDAVFQHVGFPAFLKPHDGGGWKSVYKVDSPQELFAAYDQSADLCMTLQAAVQFEEYFRCYVIDQKKVHVMRYDPGQPHHLRYVPGNPPPATVLGQRMVDDALTLCRALGYDLNTVEFAVEDGIPYAIDFMNPAPDAALESVGPEHFRWVVDAVAQMAVDRALAPAEIPPYHWSQFLAPSRLKEIVP
ncbi:Glutathione synthase/Ribosomal protein S6 modification enzyme (Glutaminyl transferase)-like protein [Candidatus Sulfopaludibacter sp. SbA3]|nr:Glutathione synthase/Ribosomal protein S6 modification enzyme (Glutaminyl transferase)-like protein [Candidatus Sulfopaludibacter sp. SbA3]